MRSTLRNCGHFSEGTTACARVAEGCQDKASANSLIELSGFILAGCPLSPQCWQIISGNLHRRQIDVTAAVAILARSTRGVRRAVDVEIDAWSGPIDSLAIG